MDPVAAKFLGAGLACLGMGLAAMGVGNIFGNFVCRRPAQPVGRGRPVHQRPSSASALAEGLGIFALVVALVLLFVV